MDQIKNKSICPYAFRGAMITVDSTVKPCCRYSDYSTKRLKVTDTNTIDDIFHSKFYQDIREKMLAGEKLTGCKRCYKEEEAGVTSMRIESSVTKSTDIELEYLEVESGRHCNLKCRSCNPDVSSGWNEDVKQSEELAVMHDFDDRMEKLDSNMYNDALAYLTKEQCSNLKQIKATGGEPFLSKSFLKFVENLETWDIAKNITLEVYTNVSFMPKLKFVQSLLKLKKIELNLSIDSIEKRNDYLRSNSDWNTVVNVIDYWFKLASQNKQKINLIISNTVSIFNILTIDQFIQYIADKEKEFDIDIQIHHVVLHWPRQMAIYNFPRHIKDKIIEYIKQVPSKLDIENYKASGLTRLLRILESSSPTTISAKKDFIHTTNSIDKIRKEDWKQVFPEVFELLNG